MIHSPNLSKYLSANFKLIDLKAKRFYFLGLSYAERNNTQYRRDAGHVFDRVNETYLGKDVDGTYQFKYLVKEIYEAEKHLDSIKLNDNEIEELKILAAVRKSRNKLKALKNIKIPLLMDIVNSDDFLSLHKTIIFPYL